MENSIDYSTVFSHLLCQMEEDDLCLSHMLSNAIKTRNYSLAHTIDVRLQTLRKYKNFLEKEGIKK